MSSTALPSVRDRSGFAIFDAGALGEAHQLAHLLLDQGRLEEGWTRLGRWLMDNPALAGGSLGSTAAHVQWHMAVFEIAVGKTEEAHRRFRSEILPWVASGRVLTDAPSLLWRLWLAGHRDGLEWDAVAAAASTALERLEPERRYVLIHQLLALAGTRDKFSIDRWLDRRYTIEIAPGEATVESLFLRVAWALRTFANRDFCASARLLACVAEINLLGGSGAQNELFEDLLECAAGAGD